MIFQKVFSGGVGEESLFKVPGERGFREKFEFSDFYLGGVLFLKFTTFLGISDINSQNFLQLWWNDAHIPMLPMLSHQSLMFSNLTIE